jgi:hypothetical protein
MLIQMLYLEFPWGYFKIPYIKFADKLINDIFNELKLIIF